jgi:hypothetical protein
MKNEPAFAILRFDSYLKSEEDRITVTRIVWDEETADAETKRLNELNADKGSRYVWQATRAARRS